MVTYAGSDQGNVLSDINTTPLIDVMLVLLIMFIITIPLQTHQVAVDLPAGDPPRSDLPDPVKNRIVISPTGQLSWNEAPVELAQLRRHVEATQRMNPIPELHLEPDALAPYAVVDEVLGVTKRAQVTKMGFVGNERYATAF